MRDVHFYIFEDEEGDYCLSRFVRVLVKLDLSDRYYSLGYGGVYWEDA